MAVDALVDCGNGGDYCHIGIHFTGVNENKIVSLCSCCYCVEKMLSVERYVGFCKTL